MASGKGGPRKFHSTKAVAPKGYCEPKSDEARLNAERAAVRLARLQEKQKQANAARKLGFTGATDDIVIAKHREAVAEAARKQQEQDDIQFNTIMTTQCGEFSRDLRAFLAGRINREPSFVRQKINDFFSRPRNAKHKEYMEVVYQRMTAPQAAEAAACLYLMIDSFSR